MLFRYSVILIIKFCIKINGFVKYDWDRMKCNARIEADQNSKLALLLRGSQTKTRNYIFNFLDFDNISLSHFEALHCWRIIKALCALLNTLFLYSFSWTRPWLNTLRLSRKLLSGDHIFWSYYTNHTKWLHLFGCH